MSAFNPFPAISARVLEAERLTDTLAFIDAAVVFNHLSIPPNFGFHALTGNRAGTHAVVVTKKLAAKVDDQTIADLDLEDYH